MEKFSFVKAYPMLYSPGAQPALIDVPEMNFLQVEGSGDPNESEGAYAKAVELLYALSYTIKMVPKGGSAAEGYFEYAVPPLEGLWWFGDGAVDVMTADKRQYRWISMIRQPEFVTPDVLGWAAGEVLRKKKLDTSGARFVRFHEGLCVQAMHVGPYSAEPETIRRMHGFLAEGGLLPDLSDTRRHHEIYLGNPRRAAPEKLRTVLRLPVRRVE